MCDFLVGERKGDEYIVKRVYFSKNIANSPVTFKMSSEDIYRADELAEREKLEIIGLFHSHPAPPCPSKLDLKFMEYWPVPWLIINGIDGATKAYVLRGKACEEVEIATL